MIVYKNKQYSVLGAGLGNLAQGAGTAVGGALAGGAQMTAGLGQVAASGAALGAGVLGKGAMLAAAHPLIAGGLAAYGLYRLWKRRRQRRMQERGYSVIEKMYSDGSIYEYRERLFSEEFIDPNEPYIPKGPREAVPKKIVKKAKKSGVVQQDSKGNWRVINMNGPEGHPVFWAPKYSSEEKAKNALRAFESGRWKKK